MTSNKKFLLSIAFVCLGITLQAQVEVAQLFSKGQSATGFGAFIHAGCPVGKADEVSGEIGFYYFTPNGSHLGFVPLLAGYRYTLNRKGTGFYLEPSAGYNFGATDIERTDANGGLLYNGDGTVQYQKLSGAMAGLCIGYLFPSASLPLNIGLRYEHVFISGDPSQNVLSLRFSWSLLTGKRLQ